MPEMPTPWISQPKLLGNEAALARAYYKCMNLIGSIAIVCSLREHNLAPCVLGKYKFMRPWLYFLADTSKILSFSDDNDLLTVLTTGLPSSVCVADLCKLYVNDRFAVVNKGFYEYDIYGFLNGRKSNKNA